MKILVTGSTGFLGKELSNRLVQLGYDIVCVGRNLKKLDNLMGKVKRTYLDIEDRRSVLSVIKTEKPDIVYHVAALIKSRSLAKLRRVNVEGTRNVLDGCLAEGVEKVVYVSSVAVIGGNDTSPLREDLPLKAANPYGRSKIEAEKLALDYRKKGRKIAILRPCMVYGLGEPHGFGLLAAFLKLRILPVAGKGENKLHLVCIDNVIDVMVLCLSNDEAYNGTYLIADKEALGIKEILFYMTKVLGVWSPIVIPESMIPFLSKLPVLGRLISLLRKERIYSIVRLEEKFGYIPRVSVYDGLKKALRPYARRDLQDA